MATETKQVVDLIEVVGENAIQVRTATVVIQDGQEINRTYHRKTVSILDDVGGEDAKVKAIANAIWSPEAIAKARAENDARLAAEAAAAKVAQEAADAAKLQAEQAAADQAAAQQAAFEAAVADAVTKALTGGR